MESNDLAKGKAAGGPAFAGGGDGVDGHGERTLSVTLKRSARLQFPTTSLFAAVRRSSELTSFKSYSDFMDCVVCGVEPGDRTQRMTEEAKRGLLARVSLPFPGVETYRLLKAATEVFLMLYCEVRLDTLFTEDPPGPEPRWTPDDERGRLEHPGSVPGEWQKLLVDIGGGKKTIPYLALIQNKLGVPVIDKDLSKGALECEGILSEKLTRPCFLELIWSYWQEEGMLVQTMNALAMRFQNRRAGTNGHADPLAQLQIDPLRPLSNVLWGYVQDEQHRLSVMRRAYEYDHHYGITLMGNAVKPLRPADTRSKFLEAFHSLLRQTLQFYKQDDDTTVVADGFPVLNALKEVHLLLTQGGHNQYGDLAWTARHEMLMQQWLLSRKELREFLPRRVMVVYPEKWMDSVDTMKSLQGWTDVSVLHFNNLAAYGERILLSTRYGTWTDPNILPDEAAAWARYYRLEIQGYIHAYRAATGVDLTQSNGKQIDATMPAMHLKNRLELQRRSRR
jgi:hypothetical protein